MQTVNCEIQLAAVEQLAYTAKFKSRYRSGQTTTLVKYPIYLESRHGGESTQRKAEMFQCTALLQDCFDGISV